MTTVPPVLVSFWMLLVPSPTGLGRLDGRGELLEGQPVLDVPHHVCKVVKRASVALLSACVTAHAT
ncbi:MAG: hypothetical protein HY709_05655 [Candidatus Latescibacteria bacterium]|nr:hypothetical protein [Candidatus Latescibacterota bacterium]